MRWPPTVAVLQDGRGKSCVRPPLSPIKGDCESVGGPQVMTSARSLHACCEPLLAQVVLEAPFNCARGRPVTRGLSGVMPAAGNVKRQGYELFSAICSVRLAASACLLQTVPQTVRKCASHGHATHLLWGEFPKLQSTKPLKTQHQVG